MRRGQRKSAPEGQQPAWLNEHVRETVHQQEIIRVFRLENHESRWLGGVGFELCVHAQGASFHLTAIERLIPQHDA
jgi:N-acetylglutamate synthase-like GNAT family acetyltransferase